MVARSRFLPIPCFPDATPVTWLLRINCCRDRIGAAFGHGTSRSLSHLLRRSGRRSRGANGIGGNVEAPSDRERSRGGGGRDRVRRCRFLLAVRQFLCSAPVDAQL